MATSGQVPSMWNFSDDGESYLRPYPDATSGHFGATPDWSASPLGGILSGVNPPSLHGAVVYEVERRFSSLDLVDPVSFLQGSFNEMNLEPLEEEPKLTPLDWPSPKGINLVMESKPSDEGTTGRPLSSISSNESNPKRIKPRGDSLMVEERELDSLALTLGLDSSAKDKSWGGVFSETRGRQGSRTGPNLALTRRASVKDMKSLSKPDASQQPFSSLADGTQTALRPSATISKAAPVPVRTVQFDWVSSADRRLPELKFAGPSASAGVPSKLPRLAMSVEASPKAQKLLGSNDEKAEFLALNPNRMPEDGSYYRQYYNPTSPGAGQSDDPMAALRLAMQDISKKNKAKVNGFLYVTCVWQALPYLPDFAGCLEIRTEPPHLAATMQKCPLASSRMLQNAYMDAPAAAVHINIPNLGREHFFQLVSCHLKINRRCPSRKVIQENLAKAFVVTPHRDYWWEGTLDTWCVLRPTKGGKTLPGSLPPRGSGKRGKKGSKSLKKKMKKALHTSGAEHANTASVAHPFRVPAHGRVDASQFGAHRPGAPEASLVGSAAPAGTGEWEAFLRNDDQLVMLSAEDNGLAIGNLMMADPASGRSASRRAMVFAPGTLGLSNGIKGSGTVGSSFGSLSNS